MNIRPFEWRDLPVLHRYRHRGLYLDTASALTRGLMLVPAGALLSTFAPATGIFTYLCEVDRSNGGSPLLGQVNHPAGASFARLTYLAPDTAIATIELTPLFDLIASQIGERGAFHILAEVDEEIDGFESMHKAGFAIYARQRIWELPGKPNGEVLPTPWRMCSDEDLNSARSLYNNLVPGLVQQAEPFPRKRLHGLVYYQEGEIIAYLEIRYGPRGVWVQPFIHPDAADFASRLGFLLQDLPNRRGRSVYLCVRSYQSWLEPAIEEMGAKAGPRQAVMVRHLALPRPAQQTFTLPAINGSRAEPSAPAAQIETNHKAL